jgi:hypothetical protein
LYYFTYMSSNAIPPFTVDGLLPHDIEATVDEVAGSFLVTGQGIDVPDWDAEWRLQLIRNAGIVARRFRQAGQVEEFWADGSFVERVARPRDIDAYYVLPREQLADFGSFRARLNALEGEDIWTWNPRDRRQFPETRDAKPPFWGRYHVEPYRQSSEESGIVGSHDAPLTFAEAFRQQRGTYKRKGIIRLRVS